MKTRKADRDRNLIAEGQRAYAKPKAKAADKPKVLDDATRRELQNAKAHSDRNPASTRLQGHTWAPPRPVSLAPLPWPTRPDWEKIGK